jgi:hypothetical protein
MWIRYAMDNYSATKKNEIMSSARKWMKLEIIMLRKIRWTEKDKYHILSLICGI